MNGRKSAAKAANSFFNDEVKLISELFSISEEEAEEIEVTRVLFKVPAKEIYEEAQKLAELHSLKVYAEKFDENGKPLPYDKENEKLDLITGLRLVQLRHELEMEVQSFSDWVRSTLEEQDEHTKVKIDIVTKVVF